MKMHLKMSSAKRRPFCLGDELMLKLPPEAHALGRTEVRDKMANILHMTFLKVFCWNEKF